MNSFKQHIPSFVDTNNPAPVREFETTEELLSLDIVKPWSSDPGFSHFAICENMLMQVRDDGFHWWVVGYIKNPADVQLPQWDHGKYRVKVNGVERIVTGTEVSSICGDDVTLRDGTKAKDVRLALNAEVKEGAERG